MVNITSSMADFKLTGPKSVQSPMTGYRRSASKSKSPEYVTSSSAVSILQSTPYSTRSASAKRFCCKNWGQSTSCALQAVSFIFQFFRNSRVTIVSWGDWHTRERKCGHTQRHHPKIRGSRIQSDSAGLASNWPERLPHTHF